MKILFVSAEVAPYVSVGGLSQVMYFLPKSLKKLGHDIRIFTAKYGAMENTNPSKKPWNLKTEIKKLDIPTSHSNYGDKKHLKKENFINCSVSSFTSRGLPKTYFLENREYFELRANVFSYKDDHVRFALLSKGALEWLLALKEAKSDWWPDIIHVNDWHTGYFVELARNDVRYKKMLDKTPIVLTVHNFFYQGNLNFTYLPKNKQDDGTKPLEPLDTPKFIFQNALLRGLKNADEINTVSPTHALEVLTPEYAAGLEDVLSRARGKLTGILNGLDTKEFDPKHDPIIKYNYDKSSFFAARKKNKLALQKEFNLEQDTKRLLLAVVGRISRQKGWELILPILPKLLSEKKDLQFIVMGQGDENYQNELIRLSKRFPEQLSLHLQTDFRIPRRIFAGTDLILIPSIFEPGGIVSLEALRYGAIPIVRRTGGLNDIILDFDPNKKTGNGFSFLKKDTWSLFGAIITAATIYNQPEIWKKLVKNALASDFSWDYAGREYQKWYKKVIEERKRAGSFTPHPAYRMPGKNVPFVS